MQNVDSINSILAAVDEINLKTKKRANSKDSIPTLNKELKILPNVDTLIQEAEEYQKKLLSKPRKDNLIQNKNYKSTIKNYNKNFEDAQKIIISNLHLKIKKLENKIENLQIDKKQFSYIKQLPNKKKNINSSTSNILKSDVVTTLKIQDTSIDILKEKIKKFKQIEETLRVQIVDLEQDKTILLNKVKKFDVLQNYKNQIDNTKENLKSIYKQVEKQKKIFVYLKNYLKKTERDSLFFKENYEKLVIANSGIKKRLNIANDQNAIYENNKQDLLLSIVQLNEILSKSNIAGKIIPSKSPVEDVLEKEKNRNRE